MAVIVLVTCVHCLSTTGAVAWLLSDGDQIDVIMTTQAGSVAVLTDITSIELLGDNTSVVHMVDTTEFIVTSFTDAKLVVESDASLTLVDNIDFTMKKDAQIYGLFGTKDTQNVFIAANVSLSPQDLAMKSLTVTETGNVTTPGGTSNIDLQCLDITINGIFAPESSVSFGTGMDSFTVGPDGQFRARIQGDVRCDTVTVNGAMNVTNNVTLRGQIRDAGETLVIGSTGRLVIDSKSQAIANWTGTSLFMMHSTTIEGEFLGGRLSIVHPDGTTSCDYWFVNVTGSAEFESADPFLCKGIDIDGKLTVYNSITLKSPSTVTELTMIIGEQASVQLDSKSTHPLGPWIATSHITAVIFQTKESSIVQLGDVKLIVADITINGELTCDAVESIEVDHFGVGSTGHVEMASPIVTKGLAHLRVMNFNVDGHMKLDTRGDHDTREWTVSDVTNTSVLNVESVGVGPGAVLYAGQLSVGDKWDTFTVKNAALMEFEPVGVFQIDGSNINGTVKSYVPMTTGRHLTGITMEIEITGTLDLDYLGPPNDTDSGSLPSYINMNGIIVSGVLQAGSVIMDALTMSVSTNGRIDASSGGYEGDHGPGGLTFTLHQH